METKDICSLSISSTVLKKEVLHVTLGYQSQIHGQFYSKEKDTHFKQQDFRTLKDIKSIYFLDQ